MHMHTVLGAYDSDLKPELLAEAAVRVGLSGVNVTEHDRLWDRHTLSRYRQEQAPLFVNNGVEVSTEMGHVIAVGLPGDVDAIEALNGANTERENVIALRVAKLLGKPVVGGSDCHSTHGIGYYCTVFEDVIQTPGGVRAALQAGPLP